jgi:hypothetical protein
MALAPALLEVEVAPAVVPPPAMALAPALLDVEGAPLAAPLLPASVASEPDGAAGSSVRLQAQPRASHNAKNPNGRPLRGIGGF